MTRKYFAAASIAIGFLATAFAGPAKAEILSLDCSDGGGVYSNVWVDFDKSAVTVHNVRPQAPPLLETFTAHITSTSIRWSVTDNPLMASNVSIDRMSGTFTQTYTGSASGRMTLQCTKGTTPPPATKF